LFLTLLERVCLRDICSGYAGRITDEYMITSQHKEAWDIEGVVDLDFIWYTLDFVYEHRMEEKERDLEANEENT